MASNKVKFNNSDGQQISAILDFPIDRKAEAYVLFAHCFTCSKDLGAVKGISGSLTRNGFAVLRFDFTGLGESEGDFPDTNFSSNVDDLICATEYLRKNYEAPCLIVGHSLGGAAAYFAAGLIKEIQAVATVGAPASPDHVTNLFQNSMQEINETGIAHIKLAGRPFTIKKQLVEDLSSKNLEKEVKTLRKPILILHSPEDKTVAIENAKIIYDAAMHPKSFISLSGADHLLTNKEDSIYVGDVIASWAKRYIHIDLRKVLKTQKQVVVSIGSESLTTEIKAGRHNLRADEPESVGGNDFGPTPYDLLLASLGSCTVITMRMYANRKRWDVKEVNVHLSYNKEHVEDCENPDNPKALIEKIERNIEIEGDLDEAQLKRMMIIADKCPVHKSLHGDIQVETQLITS